MNGIRVSSDLKKPISSYLCSRETLRPSGDPE